MKMRSARPWLALPLLAACVARSPSLTIAPPDSGDRPPERSPRIETVAPRLVACRGTEVSYVDNSRDEVFVHHGVYYTYFDGSWFYARSLAGPWTFIQMKYVPGDLFRARAERRR